MVCIPFCMPFATVGKQLQPELSGMVNNHLFNGFTPIFTDFTGVKTPKVGCGTSGLTFSRASH